MDDTENIRAQGPGIAPGFLALPMACGIITGILVGCMTDTGGMGGSPLDNLKIYSDREAHDFKPLLTRYNLDPPLKSDFSVIGDEEEEDLFLPFHKYSKMRYLNDDNTLTMHYYLEAGRGHMVATLLVGDVPGLTKVGDNMYSLGPNQVTVFPLFITDNRRTAGVGTTAFSKISGAGPACDLVVVRTDHEKLWEAEDFINRVLTEIPQVEIKVRVIEVTLQDKLEYGVDSLIFKETSSDKSFLNKPEFDGAGNYVGGGWTTKFNTESFTISGIEDFQGSLFHIAGIHDKLTLDAFLELVQRISESQILSAPKITVLDGHKAVIETGVSIPVQEVTTKANQTDFKYVYKPTGVKLVILPKVLMDDILQIEINGEVNTIAGQETIEIEGGIINIPIFTSRNISSTVTVKDGEAYALGGLIARSEIERVSKVPLLGDIPILGYLFKSKDTELKTSQIIFYIEPRIIKQGESTLYIPK